VELMKTALWNPMRLLLCLVSVAAPATCGHAVVTNVVWFRLGENDPGAASGLAATNTTALVGSRVLKAFGNPVYTNSVSTGASAHVGSSLAVRFSGSGQCFSNTLVTGLTDNFGIEAWVKPSDVSSSVRIIAYNGKTTNDGWGIYQDRTNYFGVFGGGSGVQIGGTAATATAGTWTHVALVRAGGVAGLFINGVLNGATTTTSPVGLAIGDPFAIGAIPQSPSSGGFNGTIDEVRIFTFSNGLFRTTDLLINLQRVTTQSGAALTTSSAVLNGIAQPADLPTTAWFEWGATTNYGNTTAPQSIPKTVASMSFSDSISNLVPGATYQFRADVSNGLGVAYGANLSVTLPAPPQVANTDDSGPGSLRQLVSDAAPGDTIAFAPGLAGTINLSSGPLVIGNSLNIIGPGPKLMFLTTAGASSALRVTNGNVQISGLTITAAGGGPSGDAAINNGANLTLSNCEVIANFELALLHSSNDLVLLNCSFLQNSRQALVVASNAEASVTNCTFADNGSIYGGAVSNQGQLYLIGCTVAYNVASVTGGGVYSVGAAFLGDSVIANNSAFPGGVFTPQDLAGSYTSLGYNFIGAGDGSTGFTNGINSDHIGTSSAPLNPQFAGLAYNGGQTMNLSPVLNSPLIDQGYSFGATTDQRGFARPLDFSQITNASGGDGSDIGAVEFGASYPCSACVTQVTVDVSQTLRPADGRWFGANTATWEPSFDSPGSMSLLTEMGCQTLRYPGGGLADAYHWSSNYWTAGKPAVGPTAFGNFMHMATNLGVNVFITVNYGTGTTNEAADWVRCANITNRCGFKYWEVGNENYFPIEIDSNTVPPFQPHDPWTYAIRFCDYYKAMKAVDPMIKVGAVVTPGEDAFNSYSSHTAYNPRTGLSHNGWTPVMLATMNSNGITPDFLIHHFYPENGSESDPELLQTPTQWAFDAAELRQEITDYAGPGGTNIELLSTENNSDSDYHLGKQSTSLVNGLFLADSLGRLMKTEFSSWLWWIFESGANTTGSFSPALYGWRTYGDFGLALNPTTKYPTFYALKLIHSFVQPGDTILDTGNGYPFLDVFAATATNGTLSLLFINKDRTNTFNRQITLASFSPNAAATIRSYGIPQDEATRTNAPAGMQDIATNHMTVVSGGFTYAFPPYSMTLFTLVPIGPPLAVTQTTNNTLAVSWPWPSVGWHLLQNADLTTTNWTTPPEPVQNDGTNSFIIITQPTGTRFFELRPP
jgi:alpha-L-arabinofuranosidase